MKNLSLYHLRPLMLNVGFASHHGDWNWKNVRSPFARLYYVTEGTAQIKLPTCVITLRPHHLYLVPPYIVHSDICHGFFAHYYIHIYEEQRVLEDWDFPIEVNGCEIDQHLMQRLCETNPWMRLPQSDPASYDNRTTLKDNILRNRQLPFCDKMESRGILLIFLSRFLRQAKPRNRVSDKRIAQAMDYARSNISSHISMEQLSSVACMSKDHFIRMFKKETGQTPNAWLISKKMERAELLLVTTIQPVKQIAFSLGYEDMAYFNRLFRQHVGMPPQQYRLSATNA